MGESAAATHGQNDRDIRLNARYLGPRQAVAVGRDGECRDRILRAPEGKGTSAARLIAFYLPQRTTAVPGCPGAGLGR